MERDAAGLSGREKRRRRIRRRRAVAATAALLSLAILVAAAMSWGDHDGAPPVESAPAVSAAHGGAPTSTVQRNPPARQPNDPGRSAGPSFTRPGSDPSALPGDVLIADKANDRLLEVDPRGHVVWRFPRLGALAPGQSFRVPDDAFFSPDGRRVVATQEDDQAISVIDLARDRIAYRYGVPGVPGSSPDHVYNPDDALMTSGGEILTADIKNCRLLVLRPPSHVPVRQLGAIGGCVHQPPAGFGSPNGAFPMSNGDTVVTEITGDWTDVLTPAGKLASATNPPGFTYPSDTNELRPGVFLSVDYTDPGAIESFDAHGHLRWRFAPRGSNALDHPSLALPLPNGDVLANDDYNDRVIVVDPRSNRIVWQYGHTGRPGSAPGYLNIPDGVDLTPPHSLLDRFPHARPPG